MDRKKLFAQAHCTSSHFHSSRKCNL